MPGGGQLSFETADHPGGGEFADTAIRLTVRDTGSGIPHDIQAHIFEPFFTTKPKGRGSGMGLAIVSRVLKNMQGQIFLDSEPGRGATFRIYLPVRRPNFSWGFSEGL
ncbi:MAG: HAMP domain-containing histidine kinase [Acidobacteria bacterium]|nr:HAMP domain-containing histidine kinase [Acidobacteriota bacterium]